MLEICNDSNSIWNTRPNHGMIKSRPSNDFSDKDAYRLIDWLFDWLTDWFIDWSARRRPRLHQLEAKGRKRNQIKPKRKTNSDSKNSSSSSKKLKMSANSPNVTGISPAEGPPGTKVKIRGENLGRNAEDLLGKLLKSGAVFAFS